MLQQNTVRKNDSGSARARIRIVHSQNWTLEQRQHEAAMLEKFQEQAARRARTIHAGDDENDTTLKLSLAVGALSASMFWVGYALLRWKRLL